MPTRPSSPPPPIMFPSHLAWDMARLKEYLLHHYGSTVLNTCESQNLPILPGPPLRLNVDPNAKPVACHRVQPVPLHWQERVHKDLVRDVKLGVLEKLSTNPLTTWLSRMVVTAKNNGDPRRTIDYQLLNKHVQRQTFPIETLFQLASKRPVPAHPNCPHAVQKAGGCAWWGTDSCMIGTHRLKASASCVWPE